MTLSLLLQVGYIVMIDVSTGLRTNLLRMKDAKVVGVYHPLIDEKLVQISHGYDYLLKHLLFRYVENGSVVIGCVSCNNVFKVIPTARYCCAYIL